MACVARVVCVMWQATCGVVIALGEEREGLRRVVAVLDLETAPVDGAAVEAGRGPGLEPAHAQPEPVETGGEAEGRGLADAPRRDLALADMDQAVEEGARGQHDSAGGEAPAIGR